METVIIGLGTMALVAWFMWLTFKASGPSEQQDNCTHCCNHRSDEE